MKVEEKLALCSIKPQPSSHIELDNSVCKGCVDKICLRACPAHLYGLEQESGLVKLENAGCLECGTCMLVCPMDALSWRYPDSSFGICYRYG